MVLRICDKCGSEYEYVNMWFHFHGHNRINVLCEKCKKQDQLDNMWSKNEHQYILVKKMNELLEPLRRNYEKIIHNT